ncbi:glycosyltransferase [uncultured Parabacteroides sp.]|uniref:glycosyltransferase n=1 Tax=uncultured Parabacteroides sp. TaxID=512312 RepID=UPI0026062F19|nr:glycosyltransferase [uncultured Parabacteroides sp.]
MRFRILINLHYLEIGGVETSLIGLLQALDPKRVEVDLFLNDHHGEMMQFIPEWVNILPSISAYTMIERPISEALRKGYFRIVQARLWAKYKFHRYVKRKCPIDGSAIFGYVGKYVTPVLPSLNKFGHYDLAISFLTPHNIILNKVNAKKKICWIHTDYSHIDVNKELELPVWSGYDYIASISASVTTNFCAAFPALRDKIVEIENILLPTFVRMRAEVEPIPKEIRKEQNEILLLTIGRYSYPKKMEEIPVICRLLTEKGIRVKWYIIGYGQSDEYIRKVITQEGMEKQVILLGKRTNPYPYIKACDWYIQPSRYEGNSVVVREAQILQKPVIITAYPTATSQVKNGIDGIIVPLDVSMCADKMAVALNNEELKNRIVDYLSTHDYGNESEVDKIYSLIV